MRKKYMLERVASVQGINPKRQALAELQSLACKKVVQSDKRDWMLMVQAIPQAMNTYGYMKQDYNGWNAQRFAGFMQNTTDPTVIAVKKTARSPKSVKKRKKALARIKREIDVICDVYKWKNFKKDSAIFLQAIRESFVVCRKMIKPDLYTSIPKNEVVFGSQDKLVDCFEQTTKTDMQGERLSFYERKEGADREKQTRIQYSLAPYSFPIIFGNRRW